MIYPFRCECGNYCEEVRPASESAHVPTCTCGSKMSRVWAAPAVHINGSGYFDVGLGMHVKNKGMAQQILQRNSDIVPLEVGNERKALHSIKPKQHEYDIPRGLLDGMD